jgi:hypothetical protein
VAWVVLIDQRDYCIIFRIIMISRHKKHPSAGRIKANLLIARAADHDKQLPFGVLGDEGHAVALQDA